MIEQADKLKQKTHDDAEEAIYSALLRAGNSHIQAYDMVHGATGKLLVQYAVDIILEREFWKAEVKALEHKVWFWRSNATSIQHRLHLLEASALTTDQAKFAKCKEEQS